MQCVQIDESPLVESIKSVKVKEKGDYAICIRNLYKGYGSGSTIIVNNLSISVQKGTIYALLGSSGCGKTTILSCIVGLKKWDSGSVLVFGETPGTTKSGIPGRRLGYMPQELALYDHLSVREVIQFYGRLYNMEKWDLQKSVVLLNDLLELPKNTNLIRNLSGGQQRRVSLAISLVHSPELLILDEPTVGLDPLLRQNIWNYLLQLVNNVGTSILLTTHYIEETRRSNTIGVMRNGRLIVEDSPQNLLHTYNSELLENVVKQLCRKDEVTKKDLIQVHHSASVNENNLITFTSNWNGKSTENGTESQEDMSGTFYQVDGFDKEVEVGDNIIKNRVPMETSQGPFEWTNRTELSKSCERIYGYTSVLTLTFFRFPAFLIFILFMPAFQGSLTVLGLGSTMRDLHFGIVNHELANWTLECDMPIHGSNSCFLSALSCKYLNQLNTGGLFILDSYNTEEEALATVQSGNAWGYLTFPENFSQSSLDVVTARRYAFAESIDGTQIRVHLDYSQNIAAYLMIKHIYESFMEYVRQLAETCHIGDQEAVLPIQYRPPVYGTYEDDFVCVVLPGVMGISMGGMLASLAGLMFEGDYKKGTLWRTYVAGLTIGELIISYVIVTGVINFAQVLIWSAMLQFEFHIAIQGSIWLYLVFCIMLGLHATTFGLFNGVIFRDEVRGLAAMMFFLPIFLLYGGVIFPFERIPKAWQYFGNLLPVTIPTKTLRSIIVRGLEWNHPLVWPGFGVLILWTVGLTLGTVFAYQKLCF